MARKKTYAAHDALRVPNSGPMKPFKGKRIESLKSKGGQAGAEGHPHYPDGHHVQQVTKKANTHVDGNHVFHVKGRMDFPDGGCHVASLESPNTGVRTSGAVAPRLQSKGQWLRSPANCHPPTEQRPPTEKFPVRQHQQLALTSELKHTK